MCLIENTGTSCCSNDQALIAAAIAGLNIQLKETKVNPDTKTPEYLAKFPTGKIPAFESSDGLLLVESTAIARYGRSSSFHELITILNTHNESISAVASLAPNSGLLGKDAHEAAKVDAWISYVDTELEPHRKSLYGLLLGKVPYTKPVRYTLDMSHVFRVPQANLTHPFSA